MDIKEVTRMSHVLWKNTSKERLIGRACQECLNHVIILHGDRRDEAA